MSLSPASRFIAGALLVSLPGSACFIAHHVSVREVNRAADSVRVRTPVKAHLPDGSTVVFREGVLIAGGRLIGAGTRYDLTLVNATAVAELPLDSVVGLESFRTVENVPASIALSTLAIAGGTFAAAGLAVAIFGSCPTYYSDSAGSPVLEAEGFSYSIAPLFEARDVDRLRARPRSDGTLHLEVRNEALETHFINHLELLDVTHAPVEFVAPDLSGRPAAVAEQAPPRIARDRAGRDVQAVLANADDQVYATAPSVLAGVSADDLEDIIELAFPAPESGDSVGLVLRLRNSLLNTVLFYDVMLGERGARALDWQAEELSRVASALELGSWYTSRMGLAVEIWRDGGWAPIARMKDTGPVAWKDVVVPIPNVAGSELRVRLRFPADNWRIDRATLATRFRRPALRVLPLAGVTVGATLQADAHASLILPDGRYLRTLPTQAFLAVWSVGPDAPDSVRTFLLASQGYYSEWIRPGWVVAARDTTSFRPGDGSLLQALRRWREVQDTLERRFFATRLPVR